MVRGTQGSPHTTWLWKGKERVFQKSQENVASVVLKRTWGEFLWLVCASYVGKLWNTILVMCTPYSRGSAYSESRCNAVAAFRERYRLPVGLILDIVIDVVNSLLTA